MIYTERVESSHYSTSNSSGNLKKTVSKKDVEPYILCNTDIGHDKLKKRTQEEIKKRMKKGLCLSCLKHEHI